MWSTMSHRIPPDYDAIEAGLWKENAGKVTERLTAKDKDLMKRIDTYKTRFDYASETVESKIKADSMFAATFAKEPRRTSFHEAVARQWLEDEMGIEVESLPSGGRESLYVTSDGIIMKIPKDERKPSKSLDFRWEAYGHTFYAMHKYTKESGGNQDSQYKEMQQLIRDFQRATNGKIVLIVIVDGPYYTSARMKTLTNLQRNSPPRSYATQIGNVPDIVESYRPA